jgi:hypothetical protein
VTRISRYGLSADLPTGWSGEVYTRPPSRRTMAPAGAAPAAVTPPVMHAASFSLPPERGDFGGGAVELMAATDGFVALFEYDRASATKALFSAQGVPGPLGPYDFHAQALQRPRAVQVGCQRFFNAGGRAFCLYIVLGSDRHAPTILGHTNGLLRSLVIT